MDDPSPTLPAVRTAQWVEAQAAETYDGPRPPSPCPMRHPHSDRTTVSSASDRSSSLHTSSGPVSAPLPQLSLSPTMPQERDRRASLLAFPQSPPGSGYPMSLEVVQPRGAALPKTPRASLKKRRVSLLDQIRALGPPTIVWKRDETGKKR